jgi:hypothetical protein
MTLTKAAAHELLLERRGVGGLISRKMDACSKCACVRVMHRCCSRGFRGPLHQALMAAGMAVWLISPIRNNYTCSPAASGLCWHLMHTGRAAVCGATRRVPAVRLTLCSAPLVGSACCALATSLDGFGQAQQAVDVSAVLHVVQCGSCCAVILPGQAHAAQQPQGDQVA